MATLTWVIENKPFEFALSQEPVSVGREETNRLQIIESSISRHHAVFEWNGTCHVLRDLGSFNGTFVDGNRVAESALSGAHFLHLGRLMVQYHPDAAAVPARVVLPVEGAMSICISVPRENKALVGASGVSNTDMNAHLELLFEAGRVLQTEVELARVLPKFVEMLKKHFAAEKVRIILRNEETGAVENAYTGADQDMGPISSSVINHVLDNKQAVVIDQTRNQSGFQAGQSIVDLKIQSAMCAPLWLEEKVIGMVYLDSRSAMRVFTEHDLKFLLAMANQAAIAIERSRLHERITEETQARTHLQRYMSPDVAEKILSRGASMELGGESKDVTVLFSDLRGFTSFAETQPPQDVVAMLNEYFTAMTEIIFQNHGTLDKFMGDAIMAVFGSPFSRGDDTLNAVTAAVRMQQTLTHLNRYWREQGKAGFNAGIGIASGTVVAGNIGSPRRMEFTIIGDTVNITSRLCSLASAGEILATAPVYQQVASAFAGVGLGPKSLKGRADAIEVYRITQAE